MGLRPPTPGRTRTRFPLVATPPTGGSPGVNPPLRSLRWVESMLGGLADEGFHRRAGAVHLTARSTSFLLGLPAAGNQCHGAAGPQNPATGLLYTGADTCPDGDRWGRAWGRPPPTPVPGGLSPSPLP